MTKLTEQQRDTITRWARDYYGRPDAMIRTVEHGRYLDIILPAGSPAEVLAKAEAWKERRQAEAKANAERMATAEDWALVVAHHAATGLDIPEGWEWRDGMPMRHGAPDILWWRNMAMAARIWQRTAK